MTSRRHRQRIIIRPSGFYPYFRKINLPAGRLYFFYSRHINVNVYLPRRNFTRGTLSINPPFATHDDVFPSRRRRRKLCRVSYREYADNELLRRNTKKKSDETNDGVIATRKVSTKSAKERERKTEKERYIIKEKERNRYK